jgi:hypothetical protein
MVHSRHNRQHRLREEGGSKVAVQSGLVQSHQGGPYVRNLRRAPFLLVLAGLSLIIVSRGEVKLCVSQARRLKRGRIEWEAENDYSADQHKD